MAFSSCRDKVICPAFQSTYILDDSVRLAYYSYLWKIDKEARLNYLALGKENPDDTLGVATASGGTDYFAYVEKYVVPDREVRKSKFGIVKYEPYWLKNQRLRTAPMENVLAPDERLEDTVSVTDIGEFVASDFATPDSTDILGENGTNANVDSTGFVLPTLARAPPPPPKKETKYLYRYDPKDKALNVEQEYYNKYFGDLLLDRRPEPKPVPLDTTSLSSSDESDSTKFFQRKGLGFRLNFGKNRKKDVVESSDSEREETDPLEAIEESPQPVNEEEGNSEEENDN